MPVRPTSRDRDRAVRDRDTALVNMRRTRRAVAGGASILVVGFGALAAHASAGQHAASASAASTTNSSSSTSDDGFSSSFPDSQAPQTTSQSPAVTSGGS